MHIRMADLRKRKDKWRWRNSCTAVLFKTDYRIVWYNGASICISLAFTWLKPWVSKTIAKVLNIYRYTTSSFFVPTGTVDLGNAGQRCNFGHVRESMFRPTFWTINTRKLLAAWESIRMVRWINQILPWTSISYAVRNYNAVRRYPSLRYCCTRCIFADFEQEKHKAGNSNTFTIAQLNSELIIESNILPRWNILRPLVTRRLETDQHNSSFLVGPLS